MKGKIFLCAAILIFLAPNLLNAQKSQEKDDLSLFEIDRLIRRTEYDEALRQLNIYIEKNPEKFDNAQSRIRRIMNARNQYSILAERLINLIQTDPGNNKEIYEITAQLEKFERHPSDQNLQFIADLKKSAEFNYFRAQFLEIQNETASKSQAGEYVAAVEKAKEGFWLYRDNFYEEWENDPEITGSVDSILADLDAHIFVFEDKNTVTRLNNAVNDFLKAVNQEQYEQAVNRFAEVENQFRSYNQLRLAIIKDGSDLQNKFAEVQKLDADQTDASFLPFMFRFVFGVDSVKDSGILGAVNSQWHALSKKMNDAVYEVLLRKYERYNLAVDQQLYDDVKRYASLDSRVLDLYKIAEDSPLEHPLTNPYSQYYVFTNYAEKLCENAVRITNNRSEVLKIADSQKTEIAKITESGNELSLEEHSKIINSLFNSNESITKITGNKNEQLLESFEWAQKYQEVAAAYSNKDFEGLTNVYDNTLSGIFNDADEAISLSWIEISGYYKRCAKDLYDNALAFYNSAENYRKGFFTKIPSAVLSDLNRDISKAVSYESSFNSNPELDFGIYYSYPDLSLEIANYTQTLARNGITVLDGYNSVIQENLITHPQQKENERVYNATTDAIAFINLQKENLLKLITDAQTQAQTAQRQITQATLARNEADLRFQEAQNALRKEDFETARKKLQDALTKYDESLNAKNDEELRAQTDSKLQVLGENIAKAENEIVVREVRELKTLAKDAYFNGRFDDAEKYLNQAKIRWAVTNVNEDEEISNLLNFVNTAISMKTGREILPSAPQYPEMSQLLNMAYQYFDEGSRKIGEGDRTAGEADLALALESIQKLQYVYPLNQEASILTLRINRLLDSKKFNEEFAQKIEIAKMMCKSKDTQQEGYANLLDYYQLDPNYKGLKDLIYQVEIDIGIRQKPVNNTGVARANRLVNDAQKIYNSAGNDTKKLEQALAKVDEALALVSDNKAAMSLKDKITTKIGGNTATVLSTEDERLYQLAIQRLQNNNVVGANAIVEQLLKKPQNGNSQKIKELKNKIEARS